MVKLAGYSRTATFSWSYDKVPILATGTVSGAVDANFSSESTLEFWSLLSHEVGKPLASITVDAKFNDLDWSNDNSILAGGLDNGIVEFFDAKQYKSVAKISKHSTGVKCVKFNTKQSNVLVSGGGKGEIFIWDTNKINSQGYSPSSSGTAMTPIDEVHSLAWNRSLSHVFASAGSSGYASIWDLKAKREVIHLNYIHPSTNVRNQLSVVEWHPSNSTRLATAVGSDNDSVILIWDLRNANTPLKILPQEHSKGIISLDWCIQDENLLLSSGRDNICILWNPEKGEKLTQFPTRGNWCFKAKFAPNAPDLFASASFDNKIEVQTLQNLANRLDTEKSVHTQQKSEAEFWNQISEIDSNEKPVVTKLQAPLWYGNKSPGARWAFGGKLVQISHDGKGVFISNPTVSCWEKNTVLGQALQVNDFTPVINRRLAHTINSVNEDDWNMLESLSVDGRDTFVKESLQLNNDNDDVKAENNTSHQVTAEGDDFFTQFNESYNPEGKFSLDLSKQSAPLTASLVKGDLDLAISLTLEQNLLLESLIIALDSNDDILKQKVRNAYFKKFSSNSSIARLLYSISEKNAEDLVQNVDISQWKYAAKAISTYTLDSLKRNNLYIKLGDRVLDSGNRQDALILYLAGHSLDKVAAVWLTEFSSLEIQMKSKKETIYEAHLACLTEFVERFTVLSNYVNNGSNAKITNDGLISKFLEFVNLSSSSGDFDLALRFLDILPGENEAVKTERQRVLIALGKFGSVPAVKKSNYITNMTSSNIVSSSFHTVSPPSLGSSANVSSQPTFTAQTINNSRVSPIPSGVPSSLPPVQQPRTNTYTPSVSGSFPSKYPLASSPAGIVGLPSNPYAPSNLAQNMPMNKYDQPPAKNVNGYQLSDFPAASVPLVSSVTSGQTPHLNRNANNGWNDLPVVAKEKQTRAKPVSTAPISVGSTHNLASMSSPVSIPPPPLTRLSSSSNMTLSQTVPSKTTGIPSTNVSPSVTSIHNTPSNLYSQLHGSMASVPPPINPYAPSPPSQQANPSMPSNPYAPPSNVSQLHQSPAPIISKTSSAPPPKSLRRNHQNTKTVEQSKLTSNVTSTTLASNLDSSLESHFPDINNKELSETNTIPPSQQLIIDYFTEELARVTPLIPQEYNKQLKDCNKRLKILFNHLEKQDLITDPVVSKINCLIEFMKQHKYSDAMSVHVDIATNHAKEGGNWLTGVKRLIGIAEATET